MTEQTNVRANNEHPITPIITFMRHAWLTLAVCALVALVTGSQFVYPAVLQALRRDPTALAAGEWWRLISPLLVHADGIAAWIGNSIALLIIGTVAEARMTRVRWLLLFLAGGLAGNIAGYFWEPYGAGTSVGMFGLAGGLSTALISGTELPPILDIYIAFIVPTLLGAALNQNNVGFYTGVVCAASVVPLSRFRASTVNRGIGVMLIAGAVALTVVSDNHGPAILTGAVLGMALRSRDRAQPGQLT